ASTARTNSSRSLRYSVSCMAGIGDGYCGAARREQPTKPKSTYAEPFVVRNRTTNGPAGRFAARPQGGRISPRRYPRTAGDHGILPSRRQRDLRRLAVAPIEGGDLADALHQFRAGAGELLDLAGALVAVVAGQPDLDQFMMLERQHEFRQHGRRDALVANLD